MIPALQQPISALLQAIPALQQVIPTPRQTIPALQQTISALQQVIPTLLAVLAFQGMLAFADIADIKSEPDLNRRSELALMNADEKIDAARQAYQAGNETAEQAAVEEVAESVTVCYQALEKTRSEPRKSKYYKRAELRVSALMRRLSGFRDEVSFDFRPRVEAVLKRLSDIHDELLSDIMSGKKSR